MSVRRPLRELDGELTNINYGDGVVIPCVMFTCPSCSDGHSHVIPYGPESIRFEVGKRSVLVWKHESGSTIDDITLSPSYLVQGACNVHGFVQNGHWVSC